MFCNQCEQTVKDTGRTVQGVCGKQPEASDLMDNLIYGLKGLALYAAQARSLGVVDDGINRHTIASLFSTITNVHFDPERLETLIHRCASLRHKAKILYEQAATIKGTPPIRRAGPRTGSRPMDGRL